MLNNTINTCRIFPENLQDQLVWGALARFQEVEYVLEKLIGRWKPDKRMLPHLRKQAEQIRFCLRQAKEYHDAASAVTLATQPTLLYYSAMYFALAEILFKQTGDSSLDRARSEHAHHGLSFLRSKPLKLESDIIEQIRSLKATPMSDGKRRKGTFELWHRTSREGPIVGEFKQINGEVSTSGTSVLFFPDDTRLPLLPDSGVTLFDCMNLLPQLEEYVAEIGVKPFVVRAEVAIEARAEVHKTVFVIHPGEDSKIQQILDQILIDPNNVDKINYVETKSGGILKWSNSSKENFRINFPNAIMLSDRSICFLPHRQSLNEFGSWYVLLFILGSFARYFADDWMPLVEKTAKFSLFVDACIQTARMRVPLLALSELSQTLWVSRS
jgi:hypothetical protein